MNDSADRALVSPSLRAQQHEREGSPREVTPSGWPTQRGHVAKKYRQTSKRYGTVYYGYRTWDVTGQGTIITLENEVNISVGGPRFKAQVIFYEVKQSPGIDNDLRGKGIAVNRCCSGNPWPSGKEILGDITLIST